MSSNDLGFSLFKVTEQKDVKGTASGFRKTISTLRSLSFLSPAKVEINPLINLLACSKKTPSSCLELLLSHIHCYFRSTLWGTLVFQWDVASS